MSMVRKIRISYIILLFAFAVSGNVAAENFSRELSYNHLEINLTGADSVTSDFFTVRWYLDPVGIDGVPLAEAAFLNRSSNVFILLSKTKQDAGSFSYDGHFESIGAAYVIPKYPVTINGQYRVSKFEPNNFDSSRSKEWVLGAGYFVEKNLQLSATYTRSKTPLSGPSGDHYRDNRQLGVKWLGLLSNQAAISLTGNFSRERYWDDFGTSIRGQLFGVGGNYYFTPMVSIGLKYSRQSEDDSSFGVIAHMVSTKVFLTSALFVKGEIRKMSFNRSGNVNDEIWAAEFGYRF